jgi:hypothetical protein
MLNTFTLGARAPGRPAPDAGEKVERPGLASEPFEDHQINVSDFPTTDKALATLKARFAIAGHQVYDGSNNDYIVTRCGMSRHCPDIAELRIFARVLGVNHA